MGLECLKYLFMLMIASINLSSKDLSQFNKDISDDLHRLDHWLNGNKLSLNVAKTYSILIASQREYNFLRQGVKI